MKCGTLIEGRSATARRGENHPDQGHASFGPLLGHGIPSREDSPSGYTGNEWKDDHNRFRCAGKFRVLKGISAVKAFITVENRGSYDDRNAW